MGVIRTGKDEFKSRGKYYKLKPMAELIEEKTQASIDTIMKGLKALKIPKF